MLSELEGIVRLVEGVDVELLDGDVGRREWLAHRLEKGLVPLEGMDRLLQTFGKAIGADFLALALVQRVGGDSDRRWAGQLGAGSIQARRPGPREREGQGPAPV